MQKLIALVCLVPFFCYSQRDYTSLFDKYMNAQASVNEFSGTVLVAQKGKIIYEKAFGMADKEWTIPNTIQTEFEIGSITKQFTAACILQLAEQEKLSLTDKLSEYFPDFPKGDSVTVHTLLTHTSGIKGYTELPEFWKISTLPIEKDSMVALIKRQPYNFSPGTSWSYSNSGYFLLGCIIEKVSGKSYSDYVLNNVIHKADLKNTFVNRWDTVLPYRAKGYDKSPDGWRNTSYISMEGPYSAGAMISTIEDLYQWNKALSSNKILTLAMFDKMITPYKEHYGYGLFIDSFQHHARIGHDGGINGFTSYLGYFPDDDIVVAGLSNHGGTFTQPIVNALAAILFDIPVRAPAKHREITVDSTLLNHYVGRYQQPGASKEDAFIIKNGKLYWHTSWEGEFLMKPYSNTKFFLEDIPYWEFEFDINEKGEVVKAYLIEAGVKNEMRKS